MSAATIAEAANEDLLIRTSIAVLGVLGQGVGRRGSANELVVVDLCCGAAELACAIASAHPRARVFAVDLGEESMEAARQTTRQRGLEARISVHQGMLFAPLAALGIDGRVDAVLCADAFDAGEYGIPIQRRIATEAAAFLRPGGALMFQIVPGQEHDIARLLAETGAYRDVAFANDEAMRPRVAYASRNDSPVRSPPM